ncbi:GNAT family N-acetyltransferase [Candidatus Bathycorpusculum sp.]|uniref:GNAT family N-acetyltransferase n=1 Tax=Candidatus Bathycorpusculum sp. TaxID=2994959 RepID=UPI0028298454|nr:GNAT family N-acetyltransferase [Candidatus Termitimicrobium sp.]MCL2431302.1 GNAT family N-acetyltransferase [Candidatus Termitimicrobium sp.]
MTDIKKNPKDTLSIFGYKPENKILWDNFISASKNGVFLFFRDYMEYHSHRFADHSLMFYSGDKLIALLPASVEGPTLYSHGGLTFGGVISTYEMKTPLMLQIFNSLTAYCHSRGITEIVYKPAPYIYHSIPADEDLYALFTYNAYLTARNVSSAIYLPNAKGFDGNRKDNLRKAKKNNLTVQKSDDFDAFMRIEEEVLVDRHGVKPVHSAEEIKLLADRFPDNIKLFASFKDNIMLAGVVMYESRNVAHMQYAANSKAGWNIGAQDIIEDYLIKEHYKDKRYFDFGISTENHGTLLNVGLINRKENFGASAVVYDTYKVTL